MKKRVKTFVIIGFIAIIGIFVLIMTHTKEDFTLENESSKEVKQQNKLENVEENQVLAEEKVEDNPTPEKAKEETATTEEKEQKAKSENNKLTSTDEKENKSSTNTKQNNITNKSEEKKNTNNVTNEITKISFEKAIIIEELPGSPTKITDTGEIILTGENPYISLDRLKKMNKLTIYPNNLKDSNISWSSDDKSVANFDGNKLYIYKLGEITISAITENGKRASYKLKIVEGINAYGIIKSGIDYARPVANPPKVVYINVHHSSMSRCNKKYHYEVEAKILKDNKIVETKTVQTSEKYTVIKTDYAAGVYKGEYRITDLCTDYTITGKTKETTIS